MSEAIQLYYNPGSATGSHDVFDGRGEEQRRWLRRNTKCDSRNFFFSGLSLDHVRSNVLLATTLRVFRISLYPSTQSKKIKECSRLTRETGALQKQMEAFKSERRVNEYIAPFATRNSKVLNGLGQVSVSTRRSFYAR